MGLSGDEYRGGCRVHHQLRLQQCLAVGGAQCCVDGNCVLRAAPKRSRNQISGGEAITLKIYATALSANGRKVLAVSRHLGLKPEIYDVNVYRGEGLSPKYLAVNPSGKIPTLVDGEFVLSESNAILLYLAEAHGANRLWSSESKQRSRIAQWLFWESAHWQPTLIAFLSELVGHRLLPERVPSPQHAPDWSSALVQPVLHTLEAGLSANAFLAGSEPTIADFAVAGMTTYFRAAAFPSQRFPKIADWCARIESFDSWRGTLSPLWAH
jgi:glutathione S-transferase